VSIRWSIDSTGDIPFLDLRWTESGGPAVPARSRSGFGSILIEQAFAQYGAGAARVNYLPGGIAFAARFELPNSPIGSHS
jgi:two-component sensor histidine kinase